MADFYREKQLAFAALERNLADRPEGWSFDEIEYAITKKFRIGSKSLREYVSLLSRLGKVEIVDGVVLWKS